MRLQQREQEGFIAEIPRMFVESVKEWLIKLVPRLWREGFHGGEALQSWCAHLDPRDIV